MFVEGAVVAGDRMFQQFESPRSWCSRSLAIWPERRWLHERLTSFEADEVLISSTFVPIHLPSGRLLLDQTYSGVERHLSTRFQIGGDRFTLETDPVRHPGRFLVLGGPVDGVWYHWLFNWAPRMLLAERLRPDLLADPTVKIAVHPAALEPPFVDILRAFDLPLDRYEPLDPARDHLLERAVLVSFLDQAKLFPELIREMRRRLLKRLGARRRLFGSRRLFLSRQGLPGPKRRVANFDDIAGPLAAAGFQVVELGRMSAAAQADLFLNADVVLGGHGSDFADILFCRPGTRIYVIEHDFNIRFRLTAGLDYLCELLELDYRMVRMPTEQPPDALTKPTHTQINEDFLVDPGLIADIAASEAKRRRLFRR